MFEYTTYYINMKIFSTFFPISDYDYILGNINCTVFFIICARGQHLGT